MGCFLLAIFLTLDNYKGISFLISVHSQFVRMHRYTSSINMHVVLFVLVRATQEDVDSDTVSVDTNDFGEEHSVTVSVHTNDFGEESSQPNLGTQPI